MKKLLFSALAVVAFVTTSFGKNLESEKLESISVEIFSCMQDQEAEFDLYMSHGSSYYESYFAGARAWGNCMGG